MKESCRHRTGCPTPIVLNQLLHRRVGSDLRAELEGHLQQCRACQARLARLADSPETQDWRGLLSRPGPATAQAGDPTLARARPPQPLGAPLPSLPGYEIRAELGRGGMGVVYQARHLGLNRLVAIKTLLAGRFQETQDLDRFRREAETLARLQHPNIVQVYEVGWFPGPDGGRPFMVLEFVAGGSLDRRLRGRPLAPRAAAALVATLAGAIHAAHQQGIIHRDLKPANVLLSAGRGARNGERPPGPPPRVPRPAFRVPKITDFGLAKWVAGDTGATQSGEIVGTPSYMAPEQTEGHGARVGPAADVWALGAILYECLTGKPPFSGATPLETMRRLVSDDPVPPRRAGVRAPRDLETICLKCLEKAPHRRYPTAAALADDLRRFLRGEPVRARATPLAERALKWARRRPVAAAGLAAGLLLAAILGVAGWWMAAESRANLAAQRVRCETLLSQAQELLGQHHWAEARANLLTVQAQCEGEEPLADLASRAGRLLHRADDQLAAERARAADRRRYEQFTRLRDEAVFCQTRFTCLDLPTAIRATRRTARAALDLFGLADPAGPARLPDGDTLTAAELADLESGAYELHLLLAAAVAQALPDEAGADQAREALAILDRAVRGHAPTCAWHLRRAELLARLGDPQGAAAARRAAAAEAPATVADHFLLGEAAYQAGELARAVVHLEEALNHQKEHFGAQFLLAICLLKQQRFAEAQASLTLCLERRPGAIWPLLYRGLARGELTARSLASHRPDEVRWQFRAAEDDFARAERLATDPEAQYVLLANRGAMRLQRQAYAEARQDLDRAIALRPDRYQAYVTLARLHQRQGRPAEAVGGLTQALDRAGAAPVAVRAALHRARGDLYRQQQDWGAALADLQACLALDGQGPFRADDRADLAQVLHQLGRTSEALAEFAAALQAQPGHAAAARGKAQVLLDRHRWAEAAAAWDGFFAGPGAAQATAADYLGRALARGKRGDARGAVADYTQALARQPGRPETLCARGWAYLVLDAGRLAYDDFDEGVRLAPAHVEALIGRGSAALTLGRYREALADAALAARLGPGTPRLYYALARLHARAAEAVPAADRSLHADAAVQFLAEALDRLPPAERAAFWRDQVARDAALAPLRLSPGFAALARQNGGS